MAERRPIQPDQESTPSESLHRESVDQSPIKYWLDTGSTQLNLAIAGRYPGGVPSGRVTQFVGDNSTGKSVISRQILGAAQRQGGTAIEIESEGTPDFSRANLFGMDPGPWADDPTLLANASEDDMLALRDICRNYIYSVPSTVESLFDDQLAGVFSLIDGVWGSHKKKIEPITGPVAITTDTLTAIPSKAELERRIDEASYNMERAKGMSAGFRKYVGQIARRDVAMVCIDHIRQKTNAQAFGRQWTVSGGLAMNQYPSVRVFLRHEGTHKNKAGKAVGVKIGFQVYKNKIACPFRDGWFHILFDYGIDDLRGNLEWLKDYESTVDDCPLSLDGSWYSWDGQRMGQGIDAAIESAEDWNIEDEIAEEVGRIWPIVFDTGTSGRKKRYE
jgi:recombination protein RecA